MGDLVMGRVAFAKLELQVKLLQADIERHKKDVARLAGQLGDATSRAEEAETQLERQKDQHQYEYSSEQERLEQLEDVIVRLLSDGDDFASAVLAAKDLLPATKGGYR